MEMVETEFEILRISEPVSLPFEGLDLVYEALHCSTGDPMLEVVEQATPVGPKSFADPYECLDSGVHGVFAPHGEELLASLQSSFSQKSLSCSFMEWMTNRGLFTWSRASSLALRSGARES